MNNQLFISWSGAEGKELAEFIYDWFPKILHSISPWASFNSLDLPQGRDDYTRIIDNALSSNCCLSILTLESFERPWLLFEPGIFYGQKKEVFVLLTGGLTYEKLKSLNYPLNGYHADSTKKSMLSLIDSINQQFDNIEQSKYIEYFNSSFPVFEEKYERIFKSAEDETKEGNALEISIAKMFLDD